MGISKSDQVRLFQYKMRYFYSITSNNGIFLLNMDHRLLLYFFMTTSIGLVSIGIFILGAVKAGNRYILFYLIFFISFSLYIISEMVQVYLLINIPESRWITSGFMSLISSIAVHLLLIFVPVLVHELVRSSNKKFLNEIFIYLSLIVFILTRASFWISNFNLANLEELLLFPVLMYSFIFGISKLRIISNSEKRNFTKKWLFLIFLSIFLLLGELISGGLNEASVSSRGISIIFNKGRTVYPIIYSIFSLIFIHHFLRFILITPVPASEQNRVENQNFDHMCGKYDLSPREKEVLILMLKGYNNTKIKEKLFISLGTVKTHVGNIFQKIGVKQRAELLSLFVDHSHYPSDTNKTKV